MFDIIINGIIMSQLTQFISKTHPQYFLNLLASF